MVLLCVLPSTVQSSIALTSIALTSIASSWPGAAVAWRHAAHCDEAMAPALAAASA